MNSLFCLLCLINIPVFIVIAGEILSTTFENLSSVNGSIWQESVSCAVLCALDEGCNGYYLQLVNDDTETECEMIRNTDVKFVCDQQRDKPCHEKTQNTDNSTNVTAENGSATHTTAGEETNLTTEAEEETTIPSTEKVDAMTTPFSYQVANTISII